jgi:hypothetical protein
MRFVLARFQCALDDRTLALIPRQGVQFDEVELKALLEYLNSSFTQLQAEAMGRVAGGVALLELDVRPLSSFLILDVKRLPRGMLRGQHSSSINLSLKLGGLEVQTQPRTSTAQSLPGSLRVESMLGPVSMGSSTL